MPLFPAQFSFLLLIWLPLLSATSPMEPRQLSALYATIKGFAGAWWSGPELYPDPCGWSPIEGVECEFSDGYWYVSSIAVDSSIDGGFQCNETAVIAPQLFELTRLRSFSVVNCLTWANHPVTLPYEWGAFAQTLESLEYRSNAALVGPLPSSIGSLKNLVSLVILENGLTGKLPSELGFLSKLKRLVLSGNKFWGEIPDNMGRLSEMMILDLSRNLLSGSLPLTLGGLTSVMKVDFSENKLGGKIPEIWGSMKELVILDIGGNNFSGGLASLLGELGSLDSLRVADNPKLGGDLMGVKWELLKKLEYLDLYDAGLVGTVPESLTRMESLRFVGLANNMLSGKIPYSFQEMKSLSALYLYRNNFYGELEFEEEFYVKMGRRLGLWENGNLCYPLEKVQLGRGPYGVTPCKNPLSS